MLVHVNTNCKLDIERNQNTESIDLLDRRQQENQVFLKERSVPECTMTRKSLRIDHVSRATAYPIHAAGRSNGRLL